MSARQGSGQLRARRPWIAWGLTLAALGLGLLALVVALESLRSAQDAVGLGTLLLNLATGLAGVLGAAGYAFGRRWGLYSFGLSVLGHVAAHVWLLLSAFTAHRLSIYSVVGLTVVPVVAAGVLAGMWWERRQSRSAPA